MPWKIAAGLTAAITALAVLVGGQRFDYLAPYRGLILAEYWWPIVLYAGAAILTLMASIAGLVRMFGLVDVGRKVDLVERSARRGEGDPELSRRLDEEERGAYTE